MNKLRLLLQFWLIIIVSNNAFSQYKITVNIDGYHNDTCILGYQSGKTTYIAQALYDKNEAGAFVFEGI